MGFSARIGTGTRRSGGTRMLVLATVLAGTSLPAGAMVSGFYDSAQALAAVLDTKGLADALRQQPIVSIDVDPVSATNEIWRIRSRDCRADVAVKRIPPKGTGRNSFKTRLDRTSCK